MELLQCREITNMFAPEPFRWTAEALLAMQEVSRRPFDSQECLYFCRRL